MTTNMLPVDTIVRIALREHDGESPDVTAYTEHITAALAKPDEIPVFSSTSSPLSLVRFRCLLQDTGYPAEVYLPGDDAEEAEASSSSQVDWGKLQERWVGWAVEVPGEQQWAKESSASTSSITADLAALSVSSSATALPPVVKNKYPLAALGVDNYLGALLKVYDADASFRPASAYDVVGIVSAAPVPTPYAADGEDEPPLVPAIHVISAPTPAFPPAELPQDGEATRAALVAHLASAFSPPDVVAAELLVLALIAAPATRAGGLPLGTLALNIVRPTPSATLEHVLAHLTPALVPLPISLPLLHGATFTPSSSDGTSLAPGLLQLAPNTLLLVDEDGLGDGGALAERAVKNVQALTQAITDQTVRYEYPYMDGLKMECSLRCIVTSEATSLLPSDVSVPATLATSAPSAPEADLAKFRSYLSYAGGAAHAGTFSIPAAVGEAVQDAFVEDRRVAGTGGAAAAEARLTRRMKVARLLALSHASAELSRDVWDRAVEIDAEVEKRVSARDAERREKKLGAPTVNGTDAAAATTPTAAA